MMGKRVSLKQLVDYLDQYLQIGDIPDYPQATNGLQVEGLDQIRKIAFAVDACLFSIEEAVKGGADLLIVHHGLFWELSRPIIGPLKEKLKALLVNGLSLYSVHLPLDMHREVGNNTVLARALGLKLEGSFGEFQGTPIGVIAKGKMRIDELRKRLKEVLGGHPVRVLPFGPQEIDRIGIVSGGGAEALREAVALGLDAFLTGEAAHLNYLVAEEEKISLILAGHYATEQVGLWALKEHIAERFGLETFFIPHPTGM